jgi:hypothetical protein
MAKTKSITKFDAATVETLRPQIVGALERLKSLGLTFDLGRITFSPDDFTAKLTVTLAGTDKSRDAFKTQAKYYGLQPEWLDQTVTNRGETLTVVGLDTKRRGYPVVTKMADGKLVNFAASTIALQLTPADELRAAAEKHWERLAGKSKFSTEGRLKPEWLGTEKAGHKIVGLFGAEVLMENAGSFTTVPIDNIVEVMAPEETAAREYEYQSGFGRWDGLTLHKDWLNKAVLIDGKSYTLVGLVRKGKKALMKSEEGRLFEYTLKDAKTLMQEQHPIAA